MIIVQFVLNHEVTKNTKYHKDSPSCLLVPLGLCGSYYNFKIKHCDQ